MPNRATPVSRSALADTVMTTFEAPQVATFKMVGLKENITVKNGPKNWSIEQEQSRQ